MKQSCKLCIFLLLLFFSLDANASEDRVPSSAEIVKRTIPKNYKEDYNGKAYSYEIQEPNWLEKLKQWFLSMLLKPIDNSNKGNSKIFFYLEATAYVFITLFALYIITRFILYKEGNWIFKKHIDDSTLIYKTDIETIADGDFNSLIEKALQQEDYRLAIRFFYLFVLQQLEKKEMIELDQYKTNIDYQQELEDSKHHLIFKKISYYYTYAWFGDFSIDQASFEKIAPLYKKLLNDLKL